MTPRADGLGLCEAGAVQGDRPATRSQRNLRL